MPLFILGSVELISELMESCANRVLGNAGERAGRGEGDDQRHGVNNVDRDRKQLVYNFIAMFR